MVNHAVTQCSTFPHFAKWPMGTQLAYHGGGQFAQTQFINTVWTSLVGWNDSNCTSNTIHTVYIIYDIHDRNIYIYVELDWASNSFIIWEHIGINKFNSYQRSLVSKKRKISFQSIIFIFHVPFPACLIVVLGMKVSGYPVQEILTSSSSPCGWICPITGNW